MRLHLPNSRTRYPVEIEEILKSLYVDDIISGGNPIAEVQGLKKTITSVLAEAKFTMHKWNSNDPQLESENVVPVDAQQTAVRS